MAEVKIEKWVYGGAGLGRADGQVHLVPFVMPGEEVRVDPTRSKPGLVEGRAAEFLTRSEERIAPECAYFEECGGCHYQMAPYEFQLARKVEIVREVFQRVGKFAAPETIDVLQGEPWGYRNRSQFHFQSHSLGFKKAGTDKVVDVGHCPISAPLINETLKKIRELRRGPQFPRFLKEIELFTNGEKTMVNVLETEQSRGVAKTFFEFLAREIPGANDGFLEYKVGADSFRVGHRSFFQVNRFLAEAMVECALVGAEGKTALDLYAGVGLFTLPLARRFEQVAGVESDGSAVRDLQFNAERVGLGIGAHRLQSEQYLEGLKTPPDFVLADPPRTGLGKAVVKHLIRLMPPRITLVSCDPATLSRDLAALFESGYQLEHLTMVDLFPQTYHIETISRLVRCNASPSLS